MFRRFCAVAAGLLAIWLIPGCTSDVNVHHDPQTIRVIHDPQKIDVDIHRHGKKRRGRD